MKSWKALEYKVADYFGGKRRKQYKYYVQGPDVNQPVADIEVKLRGQLPKWIQQYLSKCRNFSKSKLAIVLLYEKTKEGKEPNAADGIALIGASDLKLLLEAFSENSQKSTSEPPSPTTTRSSSTRKAPRKSRWKYRRRKWRK